MKKILAVLLVLLMALGLAACGKKDDKKDDSKEKTEAAADVDTDDEKETDSAEDVAKDFIDAYLAQDADKLASCLPDFMVDYLKESYGVDSEDELFEELEVDLFVEEKVDYEILGAEIEEETSDVDDIESVVEEVATDADIEKASKACQVSVSVELDGEETEILVICLEYDGEWYALDADI